MEYILYTDGSSRGNPGKGGWGAIIINGKTEHSDVCEIGGREDGVTNNRMEIISVIEGIKKIQSLKNMQHVHIFSDSEYVVKAVNTWIAGWKRNGWKNSEKKPVKNKEIFEELDNLLSQIHFKIEHVRAHNGHFYNERVDSIATSFADNEPVKLFEGKLGNYKHFVENK